MLLDLVMCYRVEDEKCITVNTHISIYVYDDIYISTSIYMHMFAKRSFTCTTLGSGVVRARLCCERGDTALVRVSVHVTHAGGLLLRVYKILHNFR